MNQDLRQDRHLGLGPRWVPIDPECGGKSRKDFPMATLLLVVCGGFLLAVMLWLRGTSRTPPNAELLLEVMRDSLEDGNHREGYSP